MQRNEAPLQSAKEMGGEAERQRIQVVEPEHCRVSAHKKNGSPKGVEAGEGSGHAPPGPRLLAEASNHAGEEGRGHPEEESADAIDPGEENPKSAQIRSQQYPCDAQGAYGAADRVCLEEWAGKALE